MKKAIIWVALGLMVLGVALFVGVAIAVDFDFSRLDSVKYVTNSYDITDTFDSIDISTITADIEFRLSEDGKCRVVCYEREKMFHDVSVKNGTLAIQEKDSRTWKNHITIFNFRTPRVTVYLPLGEYRTLKVENTTGDVKLSGGWNIDKVSISTTTGDVGVQDVFSRGDVSIHVTTGNILLESIDCADLSAKGATGDAVLKDVIASGSIRINQTTGDITLEKCDAGEVFVTATTGDISGTLLSSKEICAQATTGDVDVPQGTTGGRCEVSTTTGDICIRIP